MKLSQACSLVIQAGGAYNLSLANAYFDRAMAWRAKRDYDREIADLDQMLRLRPDSALGYAARDEQLCAFHR